MNTLASRLMVAERSQDIREDQLEHLIKEELDKFDELLRSFGHNVEELTKLINTQPIRVSQRLLRLYGDDAENRVKKIFPDTVARDTLIFNVRQQRKRYQGQQWSKWGVVRDY